MATMGNEYQKFDNRQQHQFHKRDWFEEIKALWKSLISCCISVDFDEDGAVLLSGGRADYETGIKPASHRVTSGRRTPSQPSQKIPALPSIPTACFTGNAKTTAYKAGTENINERNETLEASELYQTANSAAEQYHHGANSSVELYHTAIADDPSETSRSEFVQTSHPTTQSGQTRSGQLTSYPRKYPGSQALKWALGPTKQRGCALEDEHSAHAKPTMSTSNFAHQNNQTDKRHGPGAIVIATVDQLKNDDLRKGEYLNLWSRGPVKADAKADGKTDSPPRQDWSIKEAGVKGIVANLESIYPASSSATASLPKPETGGGGGLDGSLFTPPQLSTPPLNIPTSTTFYKTASDTVYKSPAEKVSEILRRPAPSHSPNKLALARLRSGRFSCNLEELRSVHTFTNQRAHPLLDNDLSQIPGEPIKVAAASQAEPQVHTARIVNTQPLKPRLESVKTSTPIEPRRSGELTGSQTQENCLSSGQRQETFNLQMQDAADLSREPSANTNEEETNSKDLFKTGEEATKGESISETKLSDEAFDEAVSGPMSIIQTSQEMSDLYTTALTDQHLKSALKSPQLSRSESGSELRRPPNTENEGADKKKDRLTSRYSSGRSSMSGSVPETEDLYCDDELHPSLENDPNMQLFSAPLMSDVDDQLHTFKNQPILGSMDAGSVLSMEMASTAPHSLRSDYGDSDVQEREDGLLRGVDHDDEAEENEIVGEEVGFGVTVGSEVFGRVCLGGSDPPMMIPNLHSTRVIP